jgi:glutamate/tyrosine decarboxylase-like PLP-dependent enzyme
MDQNQSHETSVWGDEIDIAARVLSWATERLTKEPDPHSTAQRADKLRLEAGTTITEDGIGAESALDVFDRVLAPATRAQTDPLNLAYIPNAPTQAAIAFDIAASAANVFAGYWESGAGAIHAENEALGWIRELLGWPDTAGGTFVAGGTSGNLSALHAARTHAWNRLGERPKGGWAIACAASAHSSIRSAARVLDVDVIELPVGHDGRLTGDGLAEALASRPGLFAVVASAGSTNAGIVDDMASLSTACSELGIWLHVDGAYGGAALAAPSVRDLFAGIELADSFIVDPHKWLFAPYDSCALLYRDTQLAKNAHSQTAHYLDNVDREQTNPSDLAIQLSRRARGLPFWFSLATHGTKKYSMAVEMSISTARQVAAHINKSRHLSLVAEPMLSIVLFEVSAWSDRDYQTWSTTQSKNGRILCIPTRWEGRTVLRLAFVNPRTDASVVIEILDEIAEWPT